jgi:glyoxylase I family protein
MGVRLILEARLTWEPCLRLGDGAVGASVRALIGLPQGSELATGFGWERSSCASWRSSARVRSFRGSGSVSIACSGGLTPVSSVLRMPIKLENVGIAVRDLEATIAFFTDLGLTVLGRDTVSGEWTDTAVGLDGNHANIAMLQTPDGSGRLELFEYIHPDAIETKPTQPNEIGMHRVAFSVDDIDEALKIAARHGCHPLRGVATYRDVYKLTYIRGPSGIIVMLAEELNES